MTRSWHTWGAASVFGTLLFAAAFRHGAAQSTAPVKGDAKPAAAAHKSAADADASERSEDEKAIRAEAAKFVKAFNARDAKAIAALFLPKAEYVNADGEAFTGREEIERDLAAFFKEFPEATIELEIDSIRFVGPRVAIEEGRTAVTRGPGLPPVRQTYLSVDLQVDGQWQLASVREAPDDEPATPGEHLEPLAWLVGEWIDESDSGTVHTTCRWSDDGNWLLQDFQLQIAGRKAFSGQQRLGWDPLTGHIKSWVFDSRGGSSEGVWTWDGDRWIVKASGVRPDGAVASATNFYTPRSKDSYLFESTDRIAGDDVEDDIRVVVVRRPPPPGGGAESK